ncbi:MAG: hypothetical protein CL910_03990 [Deltaproteobacteria bacterium]|jgi:hypothetical protein|nr:hypothetical protein [Deltaproteobacteria bacterium]
MMTTTSLRGPRHEPSRRARRRLARSTSSDEAIDAFASGMAELAPAQPYALYLLRRGKFEPVAGARAKAWPSFDGAGSLARYLRAHPRPIMACGTRRARCLAGKLDPTDANRLTRSGAFAMIPVLADNLLIGFVELARRDAAVAEKPAPTRWPWPS